MPIAWRKYAQQSWITANSLGWIESRREFPGTHFVMWYRASQLTGWIQFRKANGKPDHRARLLDAMTEVERKLTTLAQRDAA